ncbi:MAG: hypothetical protein FJZ47_25240 [Candidatus Tectomicrobia bacterium]|uniref:Uncharacterized protein n=1 Tax=Tectimicrobiota bacterium TaxID=2528274 RepID=A0A938B524_UNCTE|nr:hypothetical protein [Candidatus Tectomicrobia bacterium]
MHLALAHRDHGLHTILDIKIHSHVLRGDDEMRVMLSGRIESLRIAEGENAAAYAERVRAFGEQPEAIEEYRRLLDALQERLGDALRMAIPGAEVHSTPAQVSLIWPDDRNIARFRQLHFGEAIDEPRYRPVPTRQRYGAYNDPYYLYYHDPYYDLTNWLLLDSLFRRPTWSASTVHVVHGDGTMVDMQQHPSTAASAWASEIVQFDATGALHVSDTIADTWGGAEVAEASRWGSVEVETDSTENRWGGSDVSVVDTSSAGWGGSDVSGTSSSCGSSCSASSGSSCGSSCSSSC